MSSPTESHRAAVAVIGTLDTKNDEIAYIAGALESYGLAAVVIDSGILGRGRLAPAVTREQVAEASGLTLEQVQASGSRGRAVEHMQRGLAHLVPAMAAAGKIHGAICLGGAEGGLMGAAAMHALPIGFPKLIVSPSASGPRAFGPFMGSSDMLVMHSVVDIAGLNNLAVSVFDNAVAAIAGMVTNAGRPPAPSSTSVGVTMLGQTTPGATAMATLLEEFGYEPVIFHANGVGGPAMDALASQGALVGVIDFTLSELANSIMGGLHATPPTRSSAAMDSGLPVVLVPGATDFFNCGAPGTVPEEFAGRQQYFHNPVATLVRLNAQEMQTVGRRMGELVNHARGPIRVVVPTRGLSLVGVEGGALHDPEADEGLVRALRESIIDRSRVEFLDLSVNDVQFGRIVAERFRELREQTSTRRESGHEA